MAAPRLLGHITFRVPILLVEESESPEMPEVYTYPDVGPAEIISHDIPVAWHAHLRDDLVEACSFDVGEWGPADLAATTVLHEHPMPAEPRPPRMDLDPFGFEKWAR